MQEVSKMKRFLNRYSVWGTVAAAGLLSVAFLAQGQAPAAKQDAAADGGAAARRAFLDQYCVGCHNQRAKQLGVEAARHITLDTLDADDVAADAEEWEKVVRKVRAGMMPPSGMPRPEPAKFEAWIESVEGALDTDGYRRAAASGNSSAKPQRVCERGSRPAGAGYRSGAVFAVG